MTGPVPPAVPGTKPTDRQWEAIFAYLTSHPHQRHPGIIITARLANEAISWYNQHSSHDREEVWEEC